MGIRVPPDGWQDGEFIPFSKLPKRIRRAAEDFLFQLTPEEFAFLEKVSRKLGVGYHQMIAEGLYLRYLRRKRR